jgi:hypothetical protein
MKSFSSEKRGLARIFRQFEKGVPVPAFRARVRALPHERVTEFTNKNT